MARKHKKSPLKLVRNNDRPGTYSTNKGTVISIIPLDSGLYTWTIQDSQGHTIL